MSQTADRYSRALFELAQEQGSLVEVQDTMTELRKIIIDSSEFRQFLNNPLLSYEERCRVLKALFEGKIPELSYRFLQFITFKSRLGILKNIIESFDDLYLASTQQIRAYVRTALPVQDEEKNFINKYMQDKFHKNIITKWILDPSLIGGFRIFTQGKLYDYSFQNQLDHFFQQST